MAILIDTSVNILGSLTVPQLYIRMFYSHHIPGNNIHISIQRYLNKASYLDNQNHDLDIPGIPNNLDVNYDRSADGIDTLGFVHKKIRDLLSTDVTQLIAQTDPSTGEVIMDPSTGDPVYDEVIIQPKFTDVENIHFVDIDPSIIE